MPASEIDTPALVIDLDAFERNLKRMADAIAGTGVRLRPHAKTHKSPVIGLKQMALGAVGLCCQKVSEAEAMVMGGVDNVLVTNEIVGARKLERLAGLARQATVMTCADNAAALPAISAAAQKAGVTLGVLVEINVGGNRCGVEPGEAAVELAKTIARTPSLRFAGLQAYHGSAQHRRTFEERRAAIDSAIAATGKTADLLRRAGLAPEIVGGAGTGTFEMEAASGVYNELQAGSYVFMDADYARNKKAGGGGFDTFDHALFVLVTVMSTPIPERAVIDAGHKALSNDTGMAEPWGILSDTRPEPMAGATYERPSDEHGNLNLSASNVRPKLGDKVLLVPGHCDPTVNLHDWYVGVRGLGSASAHVESVWPVAARGSLF
jgi:D-serine deaminase-like pyridoxal phosphate-dependent protein